MNRAGSLIGHDGDESLVPLAERSLLDALHEENADERVLDQEWNADLTLHIREPRQSGRLPELAPPSRLLHLLANRGHVGALPAEVSEPHQLALPGDDTDESGAHGHPGARRLALVTAARPHAPRFARGGEQQDHLVVETEELLHN